QILRSSLTLRLRLLAPEHELEPPGRTRFSTRAQQGQRPLRGHLGMNLDLLEAEFSEHRRRLRENALDLLKEPLDVCSKDLDVQILGTAPGACPAGVGRDYRNGLLAVGHLVSSLPSFWRNCRPLAYLRKAPAAKKGGEPFIAKGVWRSPFVPP